MYDDFQPLLHREPMWTPPPDGLNFVKIDALGTNAMTQDRLAQRFGDDRVPAIEPLDPHPSFWPPDSALAAFQSGRVNRDVGDHDHRIPVRVQFWILGGVVAAILMFVIQVVHAIVA